MNKTYVDTDGNRIERLSRWIKLKSVPVTKRHRLYDYARDEYGYHPYQERFNSENGVFLDCFTFKGKQYSLEQFLSTSSVWTGTWNPYHSVHDEDDQVVINGVQHDDYFHPLLIEIDEYGEHVRIYHEIPREW